MIRQRAVSWALLALGVAAAVSCGGVINLPVPQISSVSPANAQAGATAFTLIVNGTGFAPTSTITINGQGQQTIFDQFGKNELSTQVTPTESFMSLPGNYPVQVFTPAPGGGTSNTVTFTVTPATAPVPHISSVSPSTVSAGASTVGIAVFGSNFVPTSVVTVNGANQTANFVNSSELDASLTASSLATTGTVQVAVLNPPVPGGNPPGGGLSNIFLLPVVNPIPVVSRVSPTVIVAGNTTTKTSIGVSGSGFDSASQVLVNGSGRPTTFGTSSQISAQLASSDLAAAGTYTVQVVNPSPGGGTSGTVSFSIVPSATGAGLPEIVDVATDGAQANDGVPPPPGAGPSMDSTGRFVVFTSSSTNLLETTTINPPPNPLTNAVPNIFLRDTCLGLSSGCSPKEILVNVGPAGVLANGASGEPVVNSNGTEVAFSSLATDLVFGFNFDGKTPQIFVTNTCAAGTSVCTQTASLVSIGSDGASPANAASGGPAISGDGRFVAFVSSATNLVNGSASGAPEVYLRDTCLNAASSCIPKTVLVSVASDGVTPADGKSSNPIVVSGKTGQFVAFSSTATNLVSGATGAAEIYRAQFCLGISKGCTASTAQLISTPDGSSFADGASSEAALSPDGRFVAFASTGTTLGGGSSGVQQVYLRDTCAGVISGCAASTKLVSVEPDGSTPGNGLSESPSIGNTGQFIAFASQATNLTSAKLQASENVFARNTCITAASGCKASTVLVSASAADAPGNGISLNPVISANGKIAAFFSAASNLVNTDLNGFPDIFLAATSF